VGEFDGNGPQNTQTWDFIAMSDDALAPHAANTAEDCQAACSADSACQYFEFRDYKEQGARCRLRNKVPYSAVNIDDASKSYVLFEVGAPAERVRVCACAQGVRHRGETCKAPGARRRLSSALQARTHPALFAALHEHPSPHPP
jgi:hypothetical protein